MESFVILGGYNKGFYDKWFHEIVDETKSLTKSNFLLYFSLLFKYMRPVFVEFYWYAELIKLDGNVI